MLKHVSQSCSDVSARRSLRQNSFSLDSRLGASAEYLDELSGLEVGGGKNVNSRATNNSSNSSAGIIVDREYRSFCMTKTGNYSGLVTLPRNMKHSSVSVLNSGSNNANNSHATTTANHNSTVKQLSESCLSLPNFSNITAIKVYAQCLRPHLSYKTVIITRHTTSRQVVLGLEMDPEVLPEK